MLSEAFKDAMSMWASGVTLVTTTESGVWHGFTASSVASLSADPEMVLVCIALSADCYDAFVAASAFGVSVLGESDKDLASRFATKGSEKFADRRRWAEGVHGIPILKSAIAVLIARTVKAIPAGDHSVLLGGVVHASSQPGDPLVYWHRNYRSVGSLTDAVNKDSHTRQGE